MLTDTPFNHITGAVIEAAIEIHRELGPGLLESSYASCLHHELSSRRLRFDRQRVVPVIYKGVELPSTYRIDFVVEDTIVIEVKVVDRLLPVHDAQVLTYLRLLNSPAGLLINFNVPRLVDGVKRIMNGRYRPAADGSAHDS